MKLFCIHMRFHNKVKKKVFHQYQMTLQLTIEDLYFVGNVLIFV